MNVWNKVFIVLIVLLGIAAVVWTVKELKVQAAWREAIKKKTDELAKTQANVEKLLLSAKATESLSGRAAGELIPSELAVKLDLLLKERNRAWFGCKPISVNVGKKPINPTLPDLTNNNASPLKMTTVELQSSQPLDAKGIVYLFDEGSVVAQGDATTDPNGAAQKRSVFLGRFSVDGPPKDNGNGAYVSSLTSVDFLTDAENAELTASQSSTWAVYVTMPTDRIHELHDPKVAEGGSQPLLFEQMDQKTLDALPPEVRDMLVNAERKPQGFEYLIAAAYHQRVVLNQTIDTLKRNIKDLDEAQKKLDEELKKSGDDQILEKERIESMQKQYDSVKAVYDDVAKLTQGLADDLSKAQQDNENFVNKIRDAQNKAKDAVVNRQDAPK
ncbi:MAG: hypothetical protein ACRC46_05760 [Thermoguttaceae bacterium]